MKFLRLYAAAGTCLVAAFASGCGSSSTTKHKTSRDSTTAHVTVCQPVAQDAVAQFLGVQAATIKLTPSVGNNTMPQCSFAVPMGGKKHVTLLVNDNTGPQPYFVLERTAIEAGQVFTANRMIAAPVAVTGLGIEADWFPAENQLMATDGVKLITVTVDWRHTSLARQRAVAEAITRPYLKQKKGKSNANGYPSG
jgi:hypothetical protein